MGVLEHLACLLRNLYAGQETTVRTGHGTADWFKTGKEVKQGCILSRCLFNFHEGYIMQNAGLYEIQAGTRNINNLRYAGDTTLTAENEEERRASLKLNMQKTKTWHLVPSLHGK